MIFDIIILLSFIFWITSVMAVFQDAKESGRSPLFWSLIVFLVPVVGLILYFYDVSRHTQQTDKSNGEKYDRLNELEDLYEEDMISEEEYEDKKEEIITEI